MIHPLYCCGLDNCITALFSFTCCCKMVRDTKIQPIGTFCIKCSDESQLFVMAKVHTAKYREPDTILPFPHHYLPNKVHPQHWVRQENHMCCPVGKLYSGNVHLYKKMQSLPLAESKSKGKQNVCGCWKLFSVHT